jgi:hypothetical protein
MAITPQDSVVGTFLQDGKAMMTERLINPGENDWVTYLLLMLLAGLAIIYFKMPERLTGFFSQLSVRNQVKTADRHTGGPGPLVFGYLLLTYLVSVSLYIYLVLSFFDLLPELLQKPPVNLLLIAATVLTLFVYRISIIRFFGALFKTRVAAYYQQQLYVSSDFSIGLVLIPVLLFSIYIQNNLLFFCRNYPGRYHAHLQMVSIIITGKKHFGCFRNTFNCVSLHARNRTPDCCDKVNATVLTDPQSGLDV